MRAASSRGNDPARFEKLLDALDEKLQFGLLDQLIRCNSYHFEGDTLHIQAENTQDYENLNRNGTRQQLTFLAQDATGISGVKIEQPQS